MAKKKIGENKSSKKGTFLLIGIFVVVIIIASLVSNFGGTKDEDPTAKFNSINIDQYLTLMKSDAKSYIYIGRTGCEYCQKTNPILAQIVDATGIKINYLNIQDISTADYQKLVNSNEIFQGDWGTPTLLIVKGGKLVDSHIGYAEYDTLLKFLTESK